MDKTIHVRPLEEEDFTAFVRLREEALRNEPEAFGPDYDSYSTAPLLDKEHYFERILKYPFSFSLGAFASDGTLIGMGCFTCPYTMIKRRHKGIMWGMYVKPEYRGRGIGKKIAELILLAAKEDAGCEQVLITVTPPGSPAHKFYESLGFIQYGIEYQALKLETGYIDEVLMMKIL
ncbi:MAG: GNAT family N-acetyltransferase [Bacteroidota bacterium]|nr:GNAT family N-acetyltransferase [Candidatus Kapabacteria bacterium]MDW8218967.1 GNAT family N-acetyltransferase [Bacteroidota bacterium]